MTETKILARLMQLAPAIIEVNARTRNRCIMATRIGIDTLRALGITALPLSVQTTVANVAYQRFVDSLGGRVPTKEDVDIVKATGAWVVDGGDPTAPGEGWSGHLVLHVPKHQGLIDLDFQQFHRPHKDIRVNPAELFAWPTGSTNRLYTLRNGVQVQIRENPINHGFADAKDWDSTRSADITQQLVQAIRKGK